MIDRYQLVGRHNPVITEIDPFSSLTVGNGELGFTVDITGLQTLADAYEKAGFPLCTMSQWGWHSMPPKGSDRFYTLNDIDWTWYMHADKRVKYAVEPQPGNETVYHWLRENPHRLNLACIGLVWDGQPICEAEIKPVKQELKLFEGIIESTFEVKGVSCRVKTACHYAKDIVGVAIESDALIDQLGLMIRFPYGSSGMSGSDWDSQSAHTTQTVEQTGNDLFLHRILDQDGYGVLVHSDKKIEINRAAPHDFYLSFSEQTAAVTIQFIKKEEWDTVPTPVTADEVFRSSTAGWKGFWQQGGAIELAKSKDPRGLELERRIVLSQYLLAIQSSGSVPPQETGLTCNSWYGKFHLEMHLWHTGYLPLWGRSQELARSVEWYKSHMDEARENAMRNGYKGIRWPKMVASEGVDSPSWIATLLIWQQPHILYMLEMMYLANPSTVFLETYRDMVTMTAEFMADFATYNSEKDCFELTAPLIPSQECFSPEDVLNPCFEVAYWKFGLEIACRWAERLGEPNATWQNVANKMAKLPMTEGCYISHERAPDTFENFAKDHPSMVGAYGLIDYPGIDKQAMERTLERVMAEWDFASMWGWDFAMMAMTATRLGRRDLAVDLLLMDTPKNTYVKSGNNHQGDMKALPLYLPGNGSLMLAVTLMTAGYGANPETLAGFPDDGSWEIAFENIKPFPY